MKRIMLDTNIYGRMVIDDELDEIKEAIGRKLVVYGSEVIRKEIRRAPRWTVKYPKNLRMDLLRLYDSLVGHSIATTPEILKLAENYYLAYSNFGGRLNKSDILTDLIVVACASSKGLDIVVSEDTDTMLDNNFQKVYQLVNKLANTRNPQFLDYKEFKILLRRLPL